jgi:hypothetical protein
VLVDLVVAQSDGILRGLRLDLSTNRFAELFTTADVDWCAKAVGRFLGLASHALSQVLVEGAASPKHGSRHAFGKQHPWGSGAVEPPVCP